LNAQIQYFRRRAHIHAGWRNKSTFENSTAEMSSNFAKIKGPIWFREKPWRHIPKSLKKFYSKDQYRQRGRLWAASISITFAMAATAPGYGWSDEEREVLRGQIRVNKARFYFVSLGVTALQTWIQEFFLRRVLFRGMMFTYRTFYPACFTTCMVGTAYSLYLMPHLTLQQVFVETGRSFVDNSLMCTVYLLSGSFYWSLVVAMVCSGINYAAMLADMVQLEEGYRRNEIVEMVTGGDTEDEFVVEYHAGSSSSSLQNTHNHRVQPQNKGRRHN